MPFFVCNNFLSFRKASFIIRKPSLISNNDASQNEQNNDSQKNENSISNNLEIIEYPYHLNYREKEKLINLDKSSFQNDKEFDDIIQRSKVKETNSSSSSKKYNKNIYRKILNHKIVNKNNSPFKKNNIDFDKKRGNKISKKTNNKKNKMFKSKIENMTGKKINCHTPDSDKYFLENHHINTNNFHISPNKIKKRINLNNKSNKNNQKIGKFKLKINSNFNDFNRNKRRENLANNLNYGKLSKNKNRTYNTLKINNSRERILFKEKKIDKINNNVGSNKSQKEKLSIERKIANNDEFKCKRVLNIMPILKKEKSSDCIGKKRSKPHILYDNHNNFHRINKINYNYDDNYNTIQIINSQRNQKNNTVLNHIIKIQNNINFSSKTYMNPFENKEKRVIRNLKILNLNKTKKH